MSPQFFLHRYLIERKRITARCVAIVIVKLRIKGEENDYLDLRVVVETLVKQDKNNQNIH